MKKSPTDAGRKLAEWVSLILSTLLILSVISYLAYLSLSNGEPREQLTVHVARDRAQQHGEHWSLPITIENKGDRAVTDLILRVTRGGDQPAEDVTIDYLGASSVEEVTLYFKQDPSALQITAQLMSSR